MHKTCGLSGKQKTWSNSWARCLKVLFKGISLSRCLHMLSKGDFSVGPLFLIAFPSPLASSFCHELSDIPTILLLSWFSVAGLFSRWMFICRPCSWEWVICVVFESWSADSGHVFVFLFVAPFWKNPEQIFKGVLLRLELLIHFRIAVLWGYLVEGGRTALSHHPCPRGATWEAAGCSCYSSCKLSIWRRNFASFLWFDLWLCCCTFWVPRRKINSRKGKESRVSVCFLHLGEPCSVLAADKDVLNPQVLKCGTWLSTRENRLIFLSLK